jgi:hypothetical protein
MQQLDGVVTIVQESRFQLLDDDGVSHQFLLGYGAAVEPEQLPSLLERRVRVGYTDAKELIGHRAARIVLLDGA